MIDGDDKPSLEVSIDWTGKSVTSSNVLFCPVKALGC